MTSIAAVQTEVRFPLDDESKADRPFLLDLYMRRTGDGVEIGVANKRKDDYAWATIPWSEVKKALGLLNTEGAFDA